MADDGKAETLEHVELFQRIRGYRIKAEFTLVRIIDTYFGRRKRVVPVVGLLVAAAFSRLLRYMPLRVLTHTGLSRESRQEPVGSVMIHKKMVRELSILSSMLCSLL
jgi:hypothetical protein